jgi:hypothetical protein
MKDMSISFVILVCSFELGAIREIPGVTDTAGKASGRGNRYPAPIRDRLRAKPIHRFQLLDPILDGLSDLP